MSSRIAQVVRIAALLALLGLLLTGRAKAQNSTDLTCTQTERGTWNCTSRQGIKPEPPPKPRRLEHVTYSPAEGRLSWVISEGSIGADGKYVRDGQLFSYVIDLDQAEMVHKGESRRFSAREVAGVLPLVVAISEYVLASVEWWEAGGPGPRSKVQGPKSEGKTE